MVTRAHHPPPPAPLAREVDVLDLARTAGTVAGSIEAEALPRLAERLRGGGGAIAYEVRGWLDASGRPAATLRLRGTLPLVCDLCGQPIDFRLDERREFRFVGSDEALAAEPFDPEDPVDTLPGPRLDVVELVEDEAILSLPISPRHAACQSRLEAADAARESAGESETGAARRPFAVLAGALKAGKH